VEVMRKTRKLNSDPNYPEDFWPKILTLLSIGAFIYWVMTSENADNFLDQLLISPI
tara:strand:+ start:22 stop:189 length:168 start_codon:yes stop_codon:yes gene_type:complete